MNNNPISDAVFEALLKQAVIDDYTDEVEAAPSKEELEKLYPISAEFDLRMNKLFARVRRKVFFINLAQYAKRAAVILIVVLNVLFAVLLTSPEVRAAIGNAVVEWFEKFTSIIYRSGIAEENAIRKEFRPQFLPNGYIESDTIDLDGIMVVMYSDGTDDIIHFSYTTRDDVSTAVSVDNEYSEVKETVINGEMALIVTANDSDGHNGVIFKYNGYAVTIWSNLSTDTLLLVADSVAEI